MSTRSEQQRAMAPGTKIALVICVSVVVLYLVIEHNGHVFGVLPYLLLLACPLMHLFMHRGHGRHSDEGHTDGN